jgi:hypothetical protein
MVGVMGFRLRKRDRPSPTVKGKTRRGKRSLRGESKGHFNMGRGAGSGHGHSHGDGLKGGKFVAMMGMTGGYMLVELIVGMLIGSLALVAGE